MSYIISNHTKAQAKKLNVIVKPSTLKGKKIDVFDKKGDKLASVGSQPYGDYGTYLKTKGKVYADTRRKAYKKRHQKTRVIVGSRSYFADKLLW